MNHGYIAVLILFTSGTGNVISTHQTNLIAREHTEVLSGRNLHEVLTLNIHLTAERNHAGSQLRILQVVGNLQHLCLALRIIVNDQLHRIQNCHHTGAF